MKIHLKRFLRTLVTALNATAPVISVALAAVLMAQPRLCAAQEMLPGAASGGSASVLNEQAGPLILYVNSYHPGYAWSDQILSGIREVLGQSFGPDMDLRVEYLDAKRYGEGLKADLGLALADIWRQKYAGLKLDLILVSDQNAYDLLKKVRAGLFPDTPLIFSGVEQPWPLAPDTTGVLASTDYRGNVDLILRTLPDTRRIWIVTDSSATGRINRRIMSELSEEYRDRAAFRFFDEGKGLEPEALLDRVGQLQARDAVFFLDYYNSPSGRYIDLQTFLPILTRKSPVPVFSHVDLYLSLGVTGGKMNSGLIQGRQIAGMAVRILGAGTRQLVPPQTELSVPTFDYLKLEHFKIPLSRLPEDSSVTNRPAGFPKRFIIQTITGASFIALQLFLIAWLLILLKRQRTLRESARQSELRFRALFEMAPYGCVVTDIDGRYILVNQAFCQSTGLTEEEAVGRTSFELGLGLNRDLYEKTRDELLRTGSFSNLETMLPTSRGDRPHLFSSRTMELDGRQVVLTATMDISKVHQAEKALLESEERFRLLFQMSPVPMAHIARDGRFIAVNRRFTQVLGFSLDEIPDKDHWWEKAYPDPDYRKMAVETWETDVRKAVDNDSAVESAEYRVTCRDGTVRDMLIGASLLGESTVVSFFDITGRKRAEEELRQSEERYRSIIAVSNTGAWEYHLDRNFVWCSPEYFTMLGYDPAQFDISGRENLVEVWKSLLHPDDRDQASAIFAEFLRNGAVGLYENHFRLRHSDGSWAWIWSRGRLLPNSQGEGNSRLIVGTHINITDRKRAEEERAEYQEQFLQAQKMESVGRLAGGVAHDFNNMLGVIIGYAELAMRKLKPEEPLHRNLEGIFNAAERSANLTRQLLAFARKQAIAPKVLDLNETVEGMLKMLRRLIGENIELAWLPQQQLWPVSMDPSQVDQILANLCINARDAITDVGRVTIETANAVFDESYCAVHAGYQPGDYVMLAVSDNGGGMDQETRLHIFEPFFTTKKAGHGTGLGLATVFGIVKQNNGFINLYSEPGQGATFKIYIPRHAGESAGTPAEPLDEPPHGRGETILLVEDEPVLLEMTGAMLESLGYSVLAAGAPGEAIRLAETHPGKIDLLITDVVMPGMNGRELAEHIQPLRPGLPQLFMSGYTANVIVHQGVLDEGVRFIPKPFSLRDLAVKTREALDRR